MADLNAQSVGRTPGTIAWTPASAGGDTAPVGDQYVLLARNGDVSSKDAQLATPKVVEGLAVAERTLSTAAGAIGRIRLGPRDVYDDGNGRVAITYPGGVTSLDVAILQV